MEKSIRLDERRIEMIHILGDSHSLTYSNSKNVECHWMGALTAHKLDTKSTVVTQLDKYPNDTWWLQFGEIDCRIHFYNKARGNPSILSNLIYETAQRYGKFIKLLSKLYNISVMATPPQGPVGNVYGYEFYADQEQREFIRDKFNVTLALVLADSDIDFIDIYPHGITPRLFFEKDLTHLNKEIASIYIDLYLKESGLC